MSDWVELGKEALKLAVRPRYSFAIWVTCLLVLAVPLPDFLTLDNFRTDHGQYIGLVGLFFFVLWAAEIFLFLVSDRLRRYLDEREKLKHLDSLNSQEAHIFVIAVEKNSQTVLLKHDRFGYQSLISKGLLERVPHEYNMESHTPCTIPRFVWEHIRKERVFKNIKAKDKEK